MSHTNLVRILYAAAVLFVGFTSGLPAQANQAEAPYTYAMRYNTAGQLTGAIAPDPDGAGALRLFATRNTFDATGKLVRTEVGQLSSWPDETIAPSAWASYGFTVHRTTDLAYNSYAELASQTVTGADGVTVEAKVQYSYDWFGLVFCKAVRMNKLAFASAPTDACALGAEGTQGPDRISKFTYNQFGQTVTEKRAVGTPLEQIYVTNGYAGRLLLSQTDASGNKTELKYEDGYGRPNRRLYPHPTALGEVNANDYNSYVYDKAGNLTYERKRNGAGITYSYDDTNRVTRKDLSDNSTGDDTEFDYDLRGLTLHARFVNNPSIGAFNTFDGFGRLTRANNVTAVGSTTVSRVLRHEYDNNGNRTRIVHPDGVYFQYGFDGLNRVDCVAEQYSPCAQAGTARLQTAEYWPNGSRLRLRTGGVVTTYVPNNAGNLHTLTHDLAYGDDDFSNTFGYNASDQIVQANQANPNYSFPGNQPAPGTYTSNGLNQYTVGDGVSLTYDLNGNLTSDGSIGYQYDMENRLVATSGVGASLKYDPLGRLSEIALAAGPTTQFLYDGDALVAEYTISGNTATPNRRYVHGGGIDEPWVQYNGATIGSSARRYLHADHQGSIVSQSASSGAMLATKLTYDAFGVPNATNYDRFGYTGQTWLKELGLFNYKARLYHPKLGRFMQADPIGNVGGMNLYQYVSSDPINRSDPTGLCDWHCTNDRSSWGWFSMLMDYTVTRNSRMLPSSNIPGGLGPSGVVIQEELKVGTIVNLASLVAPAVAAARVAAGVVEGVNAVRGAAAIRTAYRLELQSASPEAVAALNQVQNGATVYRTGILGSSRAAESQYWSLMNPANPSYASQMGVPAGVPDFVLSGVLRQGASVITNEAAALGANAGCGIQVVTGPDGVRNLIFIML